MLILGLVTPVQNKTALLNLLLEHSDEILAFGIESFGLFGSFVRDKDIRDDSDIDFLIEFQANRATLNNLVDLGDFLEHLTGRKVELVTKNSLSKFIGPHILKEAEDVPITRHRTFKTHRRSA
jgi:predicted nucleotidyltransferase